MWINTHTWYSFRYGTFSEKVLLELAQNAGLHKLALTDINNTSACLNFIRLAPNYNIQPIVGVDFRNGADQLYIALAKNNNGFHQLNNFLSLHKHQKLPFENRPPQLADVFIIYPFTKAVNFDDVNLKPNEFIGITPSDLNRLPFSIYKNLNNRCVILHEVSFRNKRDHNTHRLLRAIDNNTILSKLPLTEQAPPFMALYNAQQLKDIYADFPNIIHNTEKLLNACEIEFDFSENRKPQNQKVYGKTAYDDHKLIMKLCEEGLVYRYGNEVNTTIKDRLQKELEIIQQMGFIAYFLINWDIVSYARSRNYFYVGRGSGANSIVAYLLRITDVDPIELDLYFERFINLYRKNPPDFDIDFSWRDRDDVTQYIFNRFNHVALIATYSTFQYKAAVRELGKVFGLPKHEIDKLSKGNVEFNTLDKMNQLVLQYAQQLHGMPNQLSVHASGIVISENPIHQFTATDLPPKGFPTTQFDMIIAEDVGLYKFDILGQRGLAKIKEGLHIVKYNQPNAPEIDIHDVKKFKVDEKINYMVSQGNAIGCFYVESPAMRMLMKKLEVDTYLGLVAASSIIRPGVAKSGMMREYILRHRNPELIKRAHPIMLNIMPDTYGIMVYQEDVIKVAHYFGGLTLGEADVIRRGMSGKFRSRAEFDKVQQKFFENCVKKGYEKKVIKEVWLQIESFAGYAFAKGHSASYAVESYQSLFLKAYYPLEYCVAILNNGGGFYRSELYIHEARMLGATVHAPCINNSNYETVIKGKDIYLGFIFLKDLEHNLAKRAVVDRNENGPYQSLEDFVNRIQVGIEQLSILVRIGAFRFTDVNRRTLLWEAHMLVGTGEPEEIQRKLFKAETKKFAIPQLTVDELEDVFDQLELLGFPLCDPFLLLAEKVEEKLLTKHLPKYLKKTVTIYGYLVAVKNTSTANRDRMNFGTFLDREGFFIDTVHFPQSAKKYPFRGRGVYKIVGKVTEEFDFYSIEESVMEKLAYVQDPRYHIPVKEMAKPVKHWSKSNKDKEKRELLKKK